MERAIIVLDARVEAYVEEWLWAKGALSVESHPPHEPVRKLIALFDEPADQPAFVAELNAAAAEFGGQIQKTEFETVDEQQWQESWRDSFKPLQVGQFTLVGDWEAEGDDPHLIRIYPGQAFGTGQHETTRLVIQAMTTLDMRGKRVLDAGCGTGILSIIAERLGASDVFGFDVDPDCRDNMTRHLEMNKTRHVTLDIGVLEDFTFKPFDVILANITINVLQQIWPKLPPLLKPDGVLLNSGILATQKDEAMTALSAAGFRIGEVLQDGEWLMIEARPA